MAAAVRTGRVDFSITILSPSAHSLISLAVASQYWRSLARPAPRPNIFVGVLTPTKTMSHSFTAPLMSVEKKRLRPRTSLTTSARPGSYMGSAKSGEFQAAILRSSMSTTTTLRSGFILAITAIVGPPM